VIVVQDDLWSRLARRIDHDEGGGIGGLKPLVAKEKVAVGQDRASVRGGENKIILL
jgi:hypothetical protein